MSIETLFEVLKRLTPAEARQQLKLSIRDMDAWVLQLAGSLNGQIDSPENRVVFNYVITRSREDSIEAQRESQPLIYTPELEELREWALPRFLPNYQPVTPELLEWARRTFNEEEFLAGLREIETTGGVDITDLIQEPEQEATSRE